MVRTPVYINTEYITLGQVLKLVEAVGSGGEVKHFLAEVPLWVNEEKENRRGKKLLPGDIVKIKGMGEYQITQKL